MTAVGIGWRQPHYGELLERRPEVGFVEVHSENFFGDGGAALAVLDSGRAHYAVSLHGVGLGLGSAQGFSTVHLEKLADLVAWIEPTLVSEHVSWNAVETARVPGQLLAWRSEPGSQIDNAGIVRFEPVGEAATRIDVRLSYNPPAGSAGDVVASIFGVDPKSAMDDDLLRFKTRIENGP